MHKLVNQGNAMQHFFTDISDKVYLCCAIDAHLCTALTAASWMLTPFGEVDA